MKNQVPVPVFCAAARWVEEKMQFCRIMYPGAVRDAYMQDIHDVMDFLRKNFPPAFGLEKKYSTFLQEMGAADDYPPPAA